MQESISEEFDEVNEGFLSIANNDLETLWQGLPQESRNKVERLPPGFQVTYKALALEYALSAYNLGRRRERQKTVKALQQLTTKRALGESHVTLAEFSCYLPQA